jgi:phosphoglycerate dehydrogenase-like enzyme
LDEVLAHCDWLALACPLTDETRGLIDGDMLRRLPRGARLINIARGEVVDEAALIAALQQGHLGGAYLDVFAQEPLPPDSPLWDLPNVIVSPHNSGAAAGNDARVHALFVANFARFVASQPLVNEVEPAT